MSLFFPPESVLSNCTSYALCACRCCTVRSYFFVCVCACVCEWWFVCVRVQSSTLPWLSICILVLPWSLEVTGYYILDPRVSSILKTFKIIFSNFSARKKQKKNLVTTKANMKKFNKSLPLSTSAYCAASTAFCYVVDPIKTPHRTFRPAASTGTAAPHGSALTHLLWKL